MPSSAAEVHGWSRSSQVKGGNGLAATQDRRGNGGDGRTMGTVSATAGVGKCKEK